ncbi:MAG: MATE family efflux transporter [Lachnospiraceae bacterium]|nr:MATE family efflux transporter [Lachnospiraceae bacterium]
MEKDIVKEQNPLGTRPIPQMLLSLAVPAVIANLVNAIYNIVDQIFIGNKIGYLGNAATNVAFPLTTICMAIGLMVGLGSAAGFNLNLGKKKTAEAKGIAGTAFTSLLLFGILICIFVRLFLQPLMVAFGATEDILSYAMEYSGITSFGIPFLLFSTGTNPLVRGDGNARYSMTAIITGAIINIILDYTFMYVFSWGITGAAWATVIGQIVSAVILILYFPKFQHVKFEAGDFIPKGKYIMQICRLGFSSFAFQSSTLVVQVVLNNLLRTYGAQSVYGSEITIAVAGIMQKINAIFVAVVIGVVQGAQPICSFNYGARKYTRVREAVRLLMISTTVLSTVVFLLIQCFPRQIMGLFGEGTEEYFEFAIRYAGGFTAVMFLNGIQTSCTTFFPSIGKAWKGSVIALSKQLVLLVPLLILLTQWLGLNGLIIATPISDALAFMLAALFLCFEMKNMPKEDTI